MPQKQWETNLGRAIWIALARRCTLACLRVIFHRKENSDQNTRLKSAEELQRLATIATLASLDTSRPFAPIFLNTDVSQSGGAVLYTESSVNEQITLLENARYTGSTLPDPEYAQKFVKSHRWKLAASHCWLFDAHINVLEAEALLMALRFCIRRGFRSNRIIALSESWVCIAAVTKGRSSAP